MPANICSTAAILAGTCEHIDHVGGTARFPLQTVVAAHARAANDIARADEFVR
jgi:hypothetical protein